MTPPEDEAARARALRELDATLIVEAAAGTGKTALMAGRVTMLLLEGTPPEAIAAITFTELAASELAARVHQYVTQLLAGHIPPPLKPGVGSSLTQQQRDALQRANDGLGMLTAATIHSFCQSLITSYAVEADVDPGVVVLDRAQQDAAFDAVFEQWLKRRLSQREGHDVVSVLSREDPLRVVATLREMARFRLEHRGCQPAASNLVPALEQALSDAVLDFNAWIETQPLIKAADDIAKDLVSLRSHFACKVANDSDFANLWRLVHPPQLETVMKPRSQSKELWLPKLGWTQKVEKQQALETEEQAKNKFQVVAQTYSRLLGAVSGRVLEVLSAELDEVLDDYSSYKRAAAVLDFDDLLEKARLLVRSNDKVRAAIGQRFRHILVDEFQDTDPIQCEILFRIASDVNSEHWQDCQPRTGSLFLVGDPKQAIYRFRGADIAIYEEVRAALEKKSPSSIVHITANFRSRPAILRHVNSSFAAPLSGEGQPGYVELTPTVDEGDQQACGVMTFTVDTSEQANVGEVRKAEADCVARICRALVGRMEIEDNGKMRLVRPADIALLAPSGTELWVYEQALEEQGLTVASQAGKGFFRRQETQDLLALARVLANPSDGVAFGALLRGPLVGLTEEELLDIACEISAAQGELSGNTVRFTVTTPKELIKNPVAREVIAVLQELRGRARSTTPALLLSDALERLHVRAILLAREGPRSARAIANIEAFIEAARPYGVLGLRRFVRDMAAGWRTRKSRDEGRVAAEGRAVEITTIHSAKGLEWPIVIPINTVTNPRPRSSFVHRMSDNTIHWIVGDVVPPGLAGAVLSNETSQEHERERLWYVACTRACELLLLPKIAAARAKSWARVIAWKLEDVIEFSVPEDPMVDVGSSAGPRNDQEQLAFARDQERILAMANSLTWIRPSDSDSDRLTDFEMVDSNPASFDAQVAPLGAGLVRGLVLHKLLEEILTGELVEDLDDLTGRADALLRQLASVIEPGAASPVPLEMAQTTMKTLSLPDVAALKPQLVPELAVYDVLDTSTVTLLAGRVDALTFSPEGGIDVVLDWKSDVDPTEAEVLQHSAQLSDYMRALEARRGALVYMSMGSVRWLHRKVS